VDRIKGVVAEEFALEEGAGFGCVHEVVQIAVWAGNVGGGCFRECMSC